MIDPKADEARQAINNLLDVIDAYVRESTQPSRPPAKAGYYRRLLTGGLPAPSNVELRRSRSDVWGCATRPKACARPPWPGRILAETLESTVLQVSGQVAAAATEIGATLKGGRLCQRRSRRRTERHRHVPLYG